MSGGGGGGEKGKPPTPEGTPLDPPKIGVFLCYCGSNINGVVDVEEVAEYVRNLDESYNVGFVQTNKYTCADVGQDEIRKAVKEHKLNRVVVAACSPRMHEPTFRVTTAEAGLNPFLFEMANIREFCSWIHYHEHEKATEKAKDIVRMAIAKAKHLQPLEPFYVPVTKKCVVIGGGVSGIHTALDVADMGYQVYMVENKPSIGGKMAQLDKTFPTLDCSICILGPKMVDIARNKNIELMAYSELESVEGFIGNFKVKVRKKARYTITEDCTSCGDCEAVCPVEIPNYYEAYTGAHKAIYAPFPQAVPGQRTIDMEHCIRCYRCIEACGDRNAIDFSQKDEIVELEAGTIVVATGYEVWDPEEKGMYGYGKYPNVITSMELERLICASGPTAGQVNRASDNKRPKRLAFITCVGSRDLNIHAYCSGFCCMFTVKLATLFKKNWEDAEIYVISMDIRTNFKGYEEFYYAARQKGITFLKGRPEDVKEKENGDLVIEFYDTFLNKKVELDVEMLVLAEAAVPALGSDELAKKLNVSLDATGFYMESHPKLKPIDLPTDGIFATGATQGLKDIPYSVCQGHGAASRAARVLSHDEWEIDPIVAVVDTDLCIGCGICVKRCSYGAIHLEDVEGREKPIAVVNEAQCHGCGTCIADCPKDALQQMHFTDAQIMAQVREATLEDAENKIVGIICNWCTYGGADLAGVSRLEQPTNARMIKVMCSGRVDEDFIYEAFRRGAGIVFVGGCHIGTCHYIGGNVHAEKRIDKVRNQLVKQGMSPERLERRWISAAEGQLYAETMHELAKRLKDIGVDRIKEENEKLRPWLEQKLKIAKGSPPKKRDDKTDEPPVLGEANKPRAKKKGAKKPATKTGESGGE